ncbi:MAG: NAD-dependent DNA ligase LigA [Deltaproteobacteria bacterium]|nr:NAD-dependent DNA ligase LigA [Deltaproteobacteria bacterium]
MARPSTPSAQVNLTLSPSDQEVPPEPADKATADMTVDELAAAVRYHNHRYFTLAAPTISDYAFDALTRRLKALAPDHPALAELVAATGEERLFHDVPMLSLEKAYTADEVRSWAKNIVGPLVQAPKIDGLAASLKYDERGRLVSAVTRGDGVRGEAFTANARFISAIPQSVPATGAPFEVRGEVYLPLPVFRAKFAGTFASPRNTAAGAIKQKEPEKTADYALSFFAYSVLGAGHESLSAALAWAAEKGFPAVPHALVTPDEVQAGYEGWLARREEIPFELDGVVYTADTVSEHRRLGETAHHPRWAIAYKFQGESGTSTIVDIEWSVSRSGAITPIAVIEPVTLSGASVTRCSLHNLQILRTLGASIGARVIATRRGGVIPHIESVLEPGPEPVRIPDTCPVSGHPVLVEGDFLVCSEPHHCAAARLGTLEYWLKAVEIDGFGPKILAQIVDRGLVREPADFYRIAQADLEAMDRLGRKSAQNLYQAIQGRRRIPLDVFLAALGVDDLGWVAAKKVAQTFGSLSKVLAASEADIAAIYGLGEVTAKKIRRGLEVRQDIIAALVREVVVEEASAPAPTPTVALDPNDPVRGRSFVFTGKMATMKREEAQALVVARGGTTPDDVNKKLDVLVIGDEASALTGQGERSSKHKKADKLVGEGHPLKIISEAEFLRLIADPPQ